MFIHVKSWKYFSPNICMRTRKFALSSTAQATLTWEILTTNGFVFTFPKATWLLFLPASIIDSRPMKRFFFKHLISLFNFSIFNKDYRLFIDQHFINAMRLFVGDPVWTPINRPADDHFSRLFYLKKYPLHDRLVKLH